jgi:hypothetical protein
MYLHFFGSILISLRSLETVSGYQMGLREISRDISSRVIAIWHVLYNIVMNLSSDINVGNVLILSVMYQNAMPSRN